MTNQNKCPSKQTCLSYINRAKGLIERFEKGTGFEIDSEMETSLHWLHIQASDWCPATRRMYRSAVRYYFEIRYKQDPLILFPEFMRCTQVTRAQVRKEHGKRTSAQKSKLLFSDTYTELKIYLNQSASKYAQTIQDILLVSSTFGLRPIECAQIKKVKVHDDLIGMKIKNAKHTDGRSFGKYRTIWFQIVDEKSEGFEAFGASSRLTALFSNKSKIETDRWLKGARNFLNQLYAKTGI